MPYSNILSPIPVKNIPLFTVLLLLSSLLAPHLISKETGPANWEILLPEIKDHYDREQYREAVLLGES